MLFAGPLAVVLRGLILDAPIIPIFAVVLERDICIRNNDLERVILSFEAQGALSQCDRALVYRDPTYFVFIPNLNSSFIEYLSKKLDCTLNS